MAVTLIAHTEVGSGGASSIEFTSIPSSYDDLLFVYSLRDNRASTFSTVGVVFNSDTASVYSRVTAQATSAGAGGAQGTNRARLEIINNGVSAANSTSSTFASGQFLIPNYKTTSNHKQIIYEQASENNSSTAYALGLHAGLWRNTAAISSVKIEVQESGVLFVQYSSATLYGVTKA